MITLDEVNRARKITSGASGQPRWSTRDEKPFSLLKDRLSAGAGRRHGDRR
ncbi:MAG: hypothetical protein QXO30_02310 [Candidatus Caldarchaeum sp.]